MKQKHIAEVEHFMLHDCEMPGHCCNGKPIPQDGRSFEQQVNVRPRTPCEWYKPGKGCTHPKNPKYMKRRKQGEGN